MDYITIAFLPWLFLKKGVTIGSVSFLPLNSISQQNAQNQVINSYISRYFRCYVDYIGNPVNTITLTSINNRLWNLNDKNFEIIKQARNALCFCSIIPQVYSAVCNDDNTYAPPTFDLFELIYQGLDLNNDYIAVKSGITLSGGCNIANIKFSKPWSTGGSLYNVDTKLISGLDKCLKVLNQTPLAKRVFNSLEWFCFAHTEHYNVSDFSKIVLMVTAFESLLSFPKTYKSHYFAKQLDKYISTEEFNYRTKNNFQYSLAGWWGYDFYNLRNSIVHGNDVSYDKLLYKDWITQLIVADLVYWEILQRLLYENGFIGKEIRTFEKKLTDIFSDDSSSFDFLATKYIGFGFNDYHEKLGWIKTLL